MKRFKNILFVADREDGLEATLARAVAQSHSNDARLTVLGITPEANLGGLMQRTYGVDLDAQLRDQRLQALEALTRPHTDAGVPIYLKVVTGTPFLEIIRFVQRNSHDLLIKVAEHDQGVVRKLFGSTDMHLLRKCPCPVWIDRAEARTGDTPHYRRVLAALDPMDAESGDLHRLILDLATSLAAREQAALDVVHAWELPGESMLATGRGRVSPQELKLMLETTEMRHRDAFDRLLLPYGMSTRSGNVHMIKGRPTKIIADCATGVAADLIVMGTVGRVGVPGLLIGNTAEDVLRETRTAVLAVKPGTFVSPVQ